jgi:hypothetical protein
MGVLDLCNPTIKTSAPIHVDRCAIQKGIYTMNEINFDAMDQYVADRLGLEIGSGQWKWFMSLADMDHTDQSNTYSELAEEFLNQPA